MCIKKVILNKVILILRILYPKERAESTERGVLANLTKIYDPIGLVSPTTLKENLSTDT